MTRSYIDVVEESWIDSLMICIQMCGERTLSPTALFSASS